MRIFWLLALVLALPAQAKTPQAHQSSKDRLIRVIADATAWGEACANFSVDPEAVAHFRRVEKISVNGHYRDVFGAGYADSRAQAVQVNDNSVACDHALALYGARGSAALGLVRALWHGTVPGQMIDLDR